MLTEELHALSHELSVTRGGKQSSEAALAAEKERVLQLESEKVCAHVLMVSCVN